MLFTSCAICCVACRELSARRCTSSATTAKPRPASPAAAACMEAFNASTWVRSAIVLMRFTMPVISCERSPRRLMRFSASAIDSRMPSMPFTVSFTDPSALTVRTFRGGGGGHRFTLALHALGGELHLRRNARHFREHAAGLVGQQVDGVGHGADHVRGDGRLRGQVLVGEL